MKSQSAIEFLSTYSFLLIIIGIVITLLVYFASIGRVAIPNTCNTYGGLSCYYSNLYSNSTYSLFTFVFSNGIGIPLNLTNIQLEFNGKYYIGYCNPTFVYPDGSSVCEVVINSSIPIGNEESGFFRINGYSCNGNIKNLTWYNCNSYSNISFSGSFYLQASQINPIIFAVVEAEALPGVTLGSSSPMPPLIPKGYIILANGFFIRNITPQGILGYSYGTPGYIGNNYLGFITEYFPSPLFYLSNPNIYCMYRNSSFSAAYTMLYFNSQRTVPISIVTNDAMEVYYEVASPYSNWNKVFNGKAWVLQNATKYSSNVTFYPGLYRIAVLWSNVCGSGVQALNMSNLG